MTVPWRVLRSTSVSLPTRPLGEAPISTAGTGAGNGPTIAGPGRSDGASGVTDPAQSDATPAARQVGAVLRDVSDPETRGWVWAAVGVAAASTTLAATMRMATVRVCIDAALPHRRRGRPRHTARPD